MDNHPIPQDVTGFQFKLIGSMTIKQFAYVMAGVILAVILYYLPLPEPFGILLKMFFIPLFGGTGIALAFIPIEGRPIDVMLGNFFRALFMPNQFVYHKTGRLLSFSSLPPSTPSLGNSQTVTKTAQQTTKNLQLQQLMRGPAPKLNKLDEKEQAFLQKISSNNPTPPITQPVASQSIQLQKQTLPQPAPTPPAIMADLSLKEAALTRELNEAKKAITQQEVLQVSSAANQKMSLLQRQVQELHFQRQQLEQQLLHLQNQLATHQQTPQKPVAAPQPSQPTQANVHAVPQANAPKTGLPHVPDTANVIAGIVKDPRGNVLTNILVEVKDKQGNPVRAFKTNALGQFASATPLAAGEYTVELEDPKKNNTFDIIQLHATNQILLPIEIISHDAREELRKQLFN